MNQTPMHSRRDAGRRLPGRVLAVAGAGLLLLLLLAAALLLRRPPPAPAAVPAVPTRVPTAAAPAVAPSATPAPTPTALPAAVAIESPADGATIDFGQAVTLTVTAAEPSGVRLVSLTSNGQGIGTHRGLEQTTLTVRQAWRPEYPGTHRLVAAVTGRNGETVRTEPVVLQVIDRAMLARNAPIWARVEGNVTEMRGLAPLAPVTPNLMSRTELRRYLTTELFYTEAEALQDLLVLVAFDHVPRAYDLYYQSRRFLGENIGGFYDPETGEFVVISDDDEVDALEQWIHAHEFMHALQDQHFQLGLITDAKLGYEENLAVRALAEGEAELLQEQYLEQGYFTDQELVEIFNLINRLVIRENDSLPPVLVNSFAFPYETGYEFARTVFRRRGWAGLDAVWSDPPRSTEQILHPDRYDAGDAPQLVSLAPLTDTLGTGWELADTDVLGEFLLREYLTLRLDEELVDRAATGWGGDRFAVYWRPADDGLVLVLRLAWDTAADGEQFAAAYAEYGDRSRGRQSRIDADGRLCWQTVDVLCLLAEGAGSLVVRAPDLEAATAVTDAVQAVE